MSVTTTDDRKILVPFDKRECIGVKEAAAIAGKSQSTMRGRCSKDGLGRRVGDGTWMVSKVALAMFLDDDLKALKAYHAGDRTSDLVAPYFKRAGLTDGVVRQCGALIPPSPQDCRLKPSG
jgi:hypothetical protein